MQEQKIGKLVRSLVNSEDIFLTKKNAARLFQMKDISAEDMEAIYNMCIWNSLAYQRKIEKERENCFMESAG